jgi:hypothetical protein
MAGLVPAIHVFWLAAAIKSWMPGTRPGMTNESDHKKLCGSTSMSSLIDPCRFGAAWSHSRR